MPCGQEPKIKTQYLRFAVNITDECSFEFRTLAVESYKSLIPPDINHTGYRIISVPDSRYLGSINFDHVPQDNLLILSFAIDF